MREFHLHIFKAISEAVNIVTSKQRLKQFLTIPLYRNAIYLIINAVVVSGLSFFFWVVVARFYTEADVGYSSAIISAATLIAVLSLFGFNFSLVRFLPQVEKPQDFINTCLTLCGFTCLVLAGIFLVNIDFWSPALIFIKATAIYSATFIILTIILAFSGLVCTIFIARRRTKFVLLHNTISAVIKIPLLCLFALFAHSFGIVSSWGVAFGISLIISFFIFMPKIQSYYKPIPSLKLNLIKKDMWQYSSGSYFAHLFMSAPFLVLPLIVVNLLGSEQNAYFYIAWTIATVLTAIPNSVALSLFAEGSHFEDKLKENTRKSLKFIFLLLIPAVIILVLIGKWILLIYGQSYSVNALYLLWVLAIANIPLGITLTYTSILRVTKRVKELVVVWGFITITVLVVSYLVIPIMGIIGIGYIWLGAHCIVAIYALASHRWLLGIKSVPKIVVLEKEIF